MIEEFEKAIARGGDLNAIKQSLINQANIDRQTRWEQIEHDFRIATLISEAVRTEPKGSYGYAVAKGIINRLQAQYDPDGNKLALELKQAAQGEGRNEE